MKLADLWIGVGCRRGTSSHTIESAIAQVLQQYQFSESAIAGIATVDHKSNEWGLLQYCQDRGLTLRCFSADQLQTIIVPNPSGAVAQLGTLSVAEAAALYATGSGQLCVPKQIIEKTVTIAISRI